MTRTRKYQPATITSIHDHSHRVKEFKIIPEEPLDFAPGQFLKVQVDLGEKVKSEDYTIINSPSDNSFLSIAVDNHPKSKVGKAIHQREKGDKITIRGPYGRFRMDKEFPKQVCIVRDIGIVSVIGNLDYLVEENYQGEIFLYNLVSKKFDEIFHERLSKYSEKLNFSYTRLTREELGKKALKKGKFKTEEIDDLFGKYSDAKFYISGKSKVMKKIYKKLQNIGINKDMITKEYF